MRATLIQHRLPIVKDSHLENEALVLDLVEWLADGPKPYGEVMDAWRTSCPRLSIWEDAVDAGYLVRERSETGAVMVHATDQGRSFLQAHGRLTT